MSLAAMTWVFRHSEERLGDRLVLLAMADYAHDDGTEVFAKVETLAEKARMSKRQAQRCLRNLVEHGAIEKTGKHSSGATNYRILMGDILTPPGVTNPVESRPDLSPEPLGTKGVSDETPRRGLHRTRPGRDLLWDAFTEELGFEATTKNERGRRNAALKQIREALDTSEMIHSRPDAAVAARFLTDEEKAGELRARIARYRVRFPGVACTETAIASHWSSLAGPNGRPAVPPCPECDTGGGMHTADCSMSTVVST